MILPMKSIKFFSFILILCVFFAFALVVKKLFFTNTHSTPFVYGLKTKTIQPITYLSESNTSILPADRHTVGIYSVKKEIFLLKEVFQTAGVPYIISNQITNLKQSKIIFLDFDIDHPRTLSSKEQDFLYHYVSQGGIIIANEILPTRYGALKELFGYKDYHTSQTHSTLQLKDSPYYSYFDTRNERYYTLSTLSKAPYTNSIELGSAQTIAVYEDNSTAISINQYQKGFAINLGISIFDLRYRNLFAKDFHANKNYINDFEPLSDFITLFIKGIYEATFAQSLTLHTAKDGNQATVIMTHDIDFENSIKNIPKFTKLEKSLGIKATYNIQTKYITDDKDNAFFHPSTLKYIVNAQKEGHDIGAHTVLHTKNFFTLPKGSCKEAYPTYKPFSKSALVDNGNPTLCAELKVSKELLLGLDIPEIVSFRSGELLYHPKLPTIMENLFYRYSSCFSAEDVLSYFPYRYIKNYYTLSGASKIWEIPLVFEDELFPPLYFRTDNALKLFEKLYNNGAVFTILDHPDLTLYKLKNLDTYFIKDFYAQLPKDVWLASIKEVGEFWDIRDRIVFRYTITNKQLILKLHSKKAIDGLTFALRGITLQDNTFSKNIHSKLVLNVKKGFNTWHFDLH